MQLGIVVPHKSYVMQCYARQKDKSANFFTPIYENVIFAYIF